MGARPAAALWPRAVSLRQLFAYDPEGALIAMADGEELLVHAGDDERPLWRRRLGAAVVAVGVEGRDVLAVTEAGAVLRFEGDGGNARGALEAGQPALTAAFGRGAQAVVVDGGVVLLAGGARRRLELPGATCAAFSRRGDLLAAGASDGALKTWRVADGTVVGAFQANVGLTAICADPAGGWLATSGDRVLAIAPDHQTGGRLTGASGRELGHVAFSPDGTCFAFSLGRVVAVLARQSLETVGQFTYLENDVTGLAFGPPPWFGIGISGGDGNKYSLLGGEDATRRTDTHPGREHHSWWVKQHVVPDEYRRARGVAPALPALAAPPPPAPAAPAAPASRASSAAYALGLVAFTIAALVLVAWLVSLFD